MFPETTNVLFRPYCQYVAVLLSQRRLVEPRSSRRVWERAATCWQRLVDTPSRHGHSARCRLRHQLKQGDDWIGPCCTMYWYVQGRSDGGYIGIYTSPPNQSTLIFLCGCFVSLTQNKFDIVQFIPPPPPPESNSWLRLWIRCQINSAFYPPWDG